MRIKRKLAVFTLMLALAGAAGGFTSVSEAAAPKIQTSTSVSYVTKNHWVQSPNFVNAKYHCTGRHKVVTKVTKNYTTKRKTTVKEVFSPSGKLESSSTSCVKF